MTKVMRPEVRDPGPFTSTREAILEVIQVSGRRAIGWEDVGRVADTRAAAEQRGPCLRV